VTAEAFAALVEGRAVGRNRFLARCPAHRDRLPSLSIAEGRDGRVLVHCFAGCTVAAILAALKLSPRDLFAGPPPSPEHAASLRTAREQRARQARELRKADREAWDRVRRWEAVKDALGAKLARMPDNSPDGDGLTRTFHEACDRLHQAEQDAERTRDEYRKHAAL
jgi:hypothetical protein